MYLESQIEILDIDSTVTTKLKNIGRIKMICRVKASGISYKEHGHTDVDIGKLYTNFKDVSIEMNITTDQQVNVGGILTIGSAQYTIVDILD